MKSRPEDPVTSVSASSAQRSRDDCEFPTADVVKFLQLNWTSIAISGLISFLIALAICSAIPKEYEATVLVQVGKFSTSTSSYDLEPAEQLVARINSMGFNLNGQGPIEENFLIKASAIKNTKLIRISARAAYPDSAVKILREAVDRITTDHQKLAEESEKHLSALLQTTRKDWTMISASIDEIRKSVLDSNTNETSPITAVLLAQTQQQLLTQKSAVGEITLKLEESLANQKLFKTMAIESIKVPTDPVYPKTLLFGVIALFGGGLVGIFSALYKTALKKQPVNL